MGVLWEPPYLLVLYHPGPKFKPHTKFGSFCLAQKSSNYVSPFKKRFSVKAVFTQSEETTIINRPNVYNNQSPVISRTFFHTNILTREHKTQINMAQPKVRST
jgi:hypothetical protein